MTWIIDSIPINSDSAPVWILLFMPHGANNYGVGVVSEAVAGDLVLGDKIYCVSSIYHNW